MKGISFAVFPIPDHAFFEQSQCEGLLGDNFLEVLRFAPELLDLIGCCRASGVPGKPAFAGLAVERADDGTPILPHTLAFLHCRVIGRYPAGDHDLVVGRLASGRLHGDGKPMVHVRKSGMNY